MALLSACCPWEDGRVAGFGPGPAFAHAALSCRAHSAHFQNPRNRRWKKSISGPGGNSVFRAEWLLARQTRILPLGQLDGCGDPEVLGFCERCIVTVTSALNRCLRSTQGAPVPTALSTSQVHCLTRGRRGVFPTFSIGLECVAVAGEALRPVLLSPLSR